MTHPRNNPLVPRLPSQRRHVLLLLAAALMLFLPMLGARDIVTSHEARVGQVARQMAASGWPWRAVKVNVPPVTLSRDNAVLRLVPAAGEGDLPVNPWLVPVLSGQIRLQKPPLPYWFAAASFRLFGGGEGVARLVPALLGALATILIFDLARMLRGNVAGWIAAAVWLSSYFIFDEFRKAMADPYLAFFTLLCVWAWVSTTQANHDERPLPRADNFPPALLLILFYASLGLGALGKGPVVLVHVAIALTAYHLCYQSRLPRSWIGHLLGVAIFLLIAVPWYAYVYRAVPHALDLWRYESIGELTENVENARPWYFYLPNLLQIALPWTPLLLLGLLVPFFGGRGADGDQYAFDRRPLFPVIWYLLTVLFFSFVHLKKNAYLLPMMPAQTLIITQAAVEVISALRRKSTWTRPAGVLAAAQGLIGIGFSIVLVVLLIRARRVGPVELGCAGGAIGLATFPFIALTGGQPLRWIGLQAAAYALLITCFFNFHVAPKENERSARPACRVVERELKLPDRTLLTSRLPEEAAFYLPLDVHYDRGASRVLVVFDDRHAMKQRRNSATTAATFPPLNDWLPDHAILAIERLPVASLQDDPRWQVYELIVDDAVPTHAAK